MLRKSGFTAVEFIICLTFMMLIFGGMVSITFKKAKDTMPTQKQTNMIICSCDNARSIKCDCNGRTCTVEKIDPHGGRHEFFTVQILGGGAAGSAERGGQAGEGKIVHYPTLEGEFLVQLGEGGKYKDTSGNINGGASAIYQIKKDDKGNFQGYELLEFALGGMGSNEKINDGDIRAEDPASDEYKKEEAELQKGKAPTFASGDSLSSCGAGGDYQQNGQDGEVIIKW